MWKHVLTSVGIAAMANPFEVWAVRMQMAGELARVSDCTATTIIDQMKKRHLLSDYMKGLGAHMMRDASYMSIFIPIYVYTWNYLMPQVEGIYISLLLCAVQLAARYFFV
jgi:hypothetical protein